MTAIQPVSRFRAIAGAAALVQFALPAASADIAASYPSRPVRLIIANTTGTSVDTLSRVMAIKLGEELGQQIVADNRSGAGGTIGAESRTPQPVLDKIHRALAATLNDPATRKLMEAQGGEPVTTTGAEFLRFINEEAGRFTQAIKLADLKVE